MCWIPQEKAIHMEFTWSMQLQWTNKCVNFSQSKHTRQFCILKKTYRKVHKYRNWINSRHGDCHPLLNVRWHWSHKWPISLLKWISLWESSDSIGSNSFQSTVLSSYPSVAARAVVQESWWKRFAVELQKRWGCIAWGRGCAHQGPVSILLPFFSTEVHDAGLQLQTIPAALLQSILSLFIGPIVSDHLWERNPKRLGGCFWGQKRQNNC